MANQSMLFNDKEAISRPARAAIFNADSTTMLEHMVEMANEHGCAFLAYKQNKWVATWAYYGQEPTLIMTSTSPFNAVKQLYAEWKSA